MAFPEDVANRSLERGCMRMNYLLLLYLCLSGLLPLSRYRLTPVAPKTI
jgi:hypothetical protein